MKLLLVDDDSSTRRLLSTMLSLMGHHVVEAVDGVEALEILASQTINLVISDWVMPRMDGVELCRQLRSAASDHYTYVVLLTGKDQSDDLVQAMQAGADDFLTKPVKAKELEVRIEAGLRVLDLELSLKARNEQLQASNQALQDSQQQIKDDLRAAAAIQRDLLPKTNDTGLNVDLAWEFEPSEELAGDMFSFFALDERHLGFYLADVSGHGVPAAMLSVQLARTIADHQRPGSLVRRPAADSLVPSFIRAEANRTGFRQPQEVAGLLNRQFLDEEGNLLYFTMIYGVLDVATGKGTMCQAGHPYPLICRADGSVERLGSGGFPIGLLPDAEYEQFEFHLNRGDRLFMYSDGLTECMNTARVAFGEQRMQDFLRNHQEQSLQSVVRDLRQSISNWLNPQDQTTGFTDDVSMLAIEL